MTSAVPDIFIGNRAIGPSHPCFVIAEAGINHNGDLALARALIDAAADARADAVKFQTYKSDALVAADAPKAGYQLANTDPAESQLEMVRKCELSFDDFRLVREHCRKRGIIFLSTPFDDESLAFLVSLGVPALKIGSGEITNLPLLRRAGGAGLPVILSTGMSDLAEVEAAAGALRAAGCRDLAILHCVSDYPAEPADANLRAMATIRAALRAPVGFSDHTTGLSVALASVALGACVLEKHFTLDKTLPGPDHVASLDPKELGELIGAVRTVEAALGDGVKTARASEIGTRVVARRSLFLARDMAADEALCAEHLVALRPGTGIPPSALDSVTGRTTARILKAGHMLQWRDLA